MAHVHGMIDQPRDRQRTVASEVRPHADEISERARAITTITRASNEVRLAYIFGFLRFEWLSAQQLAW
jgi:hypothetical protein